MFRIEDLNIPQLSILFVRIDKITGLSPRIRSLRPKGQSPSFSNLLGSFTVKWTNYNWPLDQGSMMQCLGGWVWKNRDPGSNLPSATKAGVNFESVISAQPVSQGCW